MLHNTLAAWGAPARAFHWVMAAMILVQVGLGLAAVAWRVSPAKLELFVWHKSLGVLILVLVALRLAWRLANATPALPASMPAWERAAARASHALLYILMFALPFTGWIVNSAANIPFRIFWLVPLPAIVAPDKPLAELFARVHDGLAAALAVVLLAHVAAALRHHYVVRDDVLARMLREPGEGGVSRVLAALAAFFMACAISHAADWRMDRAGSRLEFAAAFEGNPVPGTFKDFDARLRFDPEKPEGGSLDVTVKVTSADMGIADVNREIRGKDWFDYAGFPQAEFHSTDLRRVQGSRYAARGTLSLKGAKQPVEVPFTWTGSGDAATMEGELTLKRGAFGIGTGEWAATSVIGADVKVKFVVKLRRAG